MDKLSVINLSNEIHKAGFKNFSVEKLKKQNGVKITLYGSCKKVDIKVIKRELSYIMEVSEIGNEELVYKLIHAMLEYLK